LNFRFSARNGKEGSGSGSGWSNLYDNATIYISSMQHFLFMAKAWLEFSKL